MLAEKLTLAKGMKNEEAKISLIILSFPKNTGNMIIIIDTMKI